MSAQPDTLVLAMRDTMRAAPRSASPVLRALVVDEDADVGELLVYTLRSHGYMATRATRPQYAIQHCATEPPDVVLLDPVLPWPAGLALCRQLRNAFTGPIIVVTTRAAVEDVREGFAAGADDYIVKPFSPQDLISRLASATARARRLREEPAP